MPRGRTYCGDVVWRVLELYAMNDQDSDNVMALRRKKGANPPGGLALRCVGRTSKQKRSNCRTPQRTEKRATLATRARRIAWFVFLALFCHAGCPKVKPRREGLEPPPVGLEIRCSIRVSYRSYENPFSQPALAGTRSHVRSRAKGFAGQAGRSEASRHAARFFAALRMTSLRSE
jgi:hypothetical protein